MTWYPRAVRKQLTVPNRARNKVRMPSPVRINLHTAVSNGGSLYGFFNSAGARGVFSHFYVTRDGVVEQYQSIDYRAACDLDGNPDTISIETWDGYPKGAPGYWRNASDVPPWNEAQLRAIADLVAWILEQRPTIPRKLATTNRRSGTSSHGLSWHRLGVVGAPGHIPRSSGGLRYSTSPGKICPGPRRIAQIPAILTAATTVVAGKQLTDTERYLKTMDDEKFKTLTREAVGGTFWDPPIPDRRGTGDHWGNSLRHSAAEAAHNSALTLGLVRQLAKQQGVDIDEQAIIAGLVDTLAPSLTTAVEKAVAKGGSPQVIAEAVRKELGAAMTG